MKTSMVEPTAMRTLIGTTMAPKMALALVPVQNMVGNLVRLTPL